MTKQRRRSRFRIRPACSACSKAVKLRMCCRSGRELHLHFLRTTRRMLGNAQSIVTGLELERNELQQQPDGSQRPVSTGATEALQVCPGLVCSDHTLQAGCEMCSLMTSSRSCQVAYCRIWKACTPRSLVVGAVKADRRRLHAGS